MLPRWCSDAVTVRRAPYKEQRGTRVRDWENATEHTVEGCSVQPASTSTQWTDPRQALTVRAVLYAPPGADIVEGDRIDFAGASYALDGAPLEWRSPTGAVSHVQAQLVDWRQ